MMMKLMKKNMLKLLKTKIKTLLKCKEEKTPKYFY